MLPENEWYIEAPWGRISIMAWGDCWDPPVLLCHNTMESAATFRPLVKLLPRNFYYIAMELPGNGKSDPYPPGLLFSVFDLVYAVRVVVQHFGWKQFVYIAHSTGCLIGKMYNLCYPGGMSLVVDLDPAPAYKTMTLKEYPHFHQKSINTFLNGYNKFNASKDLLPKYPIKKAVKILKTKFGISEQLAKEALVRVSEHAGEGLVRFTFDQRYRLFEPPVYPPSYLRQLYTSMQTPTLCIVAKDSVKAGLYTKAPLEVEYPNQNFRYYYVQGRANVHLTSPERIASYVDSFLLYGLNGLDRKSNAKL